MATRLCKRCGEPALSPRHQYCGPCRDQAEIARQRKIYPSRRGRRSELTDEQKERRRTRYGAEHGRIRAQWKARIDAGEEVPCNRCGAPIEQGTKWHLDHDEDGSYRGPAHQFCNESAASGIPLTPSELERRREKRRRWAANGRDRGKVVYGKEHREAREEWGRRIAAGGVVCVRCREPLSSDEPWDLGHDDLLSEIILGPECRKCNRVSGGKKGMGTLPAASSQAWSRKWLPA